MLETINNKKINITEKQLETISNMDCLIKGGFATIKGYKPSSGYVESPTKDITFISRFNTMKLYERKVEKLENLSFEDIEIKGEKLLSLSEDEQREQFKICIGKSIISMQKSLYGIREDAHRIAHDTFYITVSQGIKIHLETEKINDKTVLVLKDGYPIAKNIMLNAIEISSKTIKEGVYKVVNSGVKVLMDNCIKRAINQRSIGFKTFSLKEDNFETVNMGGMKFTVDSILEEVRETVKLIDKDDLKSILEVETEVKR